MENSIPNYEGNKMISVGKKKEIISTCSLCLPPFDQAWEHQLSTQYPCIHFFQLSELAKLLHLGSYIPIPRRISDYSVTC